MTYRQQIGTKYEYYVLEHIRKDYEKVWHWKDFPEKIMYELNLIKDYNKFKKYRTDIGADLVAFKDNKYYFIQCKNFKDTIFIDTLAGFYYLLYENNLNGILYYNGILSERLVDLSTGKIPFINLPFNNENIIFKEEISTITFRDYQLEAYNKLKDLDNCILSLPCSMGKTYISSMLGKDYDNIIILSPTRALTQQTLEKFKEYLKNTYNYILVSIDGKTKIDEINKVLKSKNVISSTFDSCNIVNLLINKLKNCYIIIDEFHNLSENNINDVNNEINKLINYNANKVFVSATPIKNFMELTETNIYTYKWNDAIKNKYICDFNVYLPDLSRELIKSLEIITTNYDDMELKLIKKAYNLVKSMLLNGDKKCICYLTTIAKANIFNKILTLIANAFNIEIDREQIDCNTRRLKRSEIIDKFKKSTKLFILLNIHVLDEGIDIPECDSVYITQPNNNIINIVQRMCRANRIYKNKTECNIYLWCSEKKADNTLDYLFDKMDESVKNKIYKISQHENNNCIIKKYDIMQNTSKIVVSNNIYEYLINCVQTADKIPVKFIEDFYTFYDEGKNEYDFTISLELVSTWLNVRKEHLKTLLVSNFIKNTDYIEQKVSGQKGKGTNNRIDVLLTYRCSKLLCMISKSEKASIIRNFYIELEKLIITYKDNIVNDLNKQLGVQVNNEKIIKENSGEGLLYILKVDDDTYEIGNTNELKKRMAPYNTGRKHELSIALAFKCKNIEEVEKCVKSNLSKYRYKKHKNNELFKVDDDFIKDTIVYCNKKSIKIKENKKLLKSTTLKNWLIIIDKTNTDITELYKPVKKYQRKTGINKTSKAVSKKTSKIASKKGSKNISKKTSKIASKKGSKNTSKK